jgi:hypothetical protein
MNKIIAFILSWILHRANRETKLPEFYAIKNSILKKYGKHLGYDVQFIEGKKCFTCGGGGIYYGYSQDVECNRCDGTGWYKLPVWNILERVQFGKYIFHQPFKRAYKKPDISVAPIDGYIEHTRAKYGALSLTILFLLYNRKAISKQYRDFGMGWRYYWYWPSNWAYSIAHIIRYRTNAVPFTNLKQKIKFPKPVTKIFPQLETDDLPF